MTGAHPAGPLVTLSSDFGTGSPYVAAMKAAVLAGCPGATLIDVSHSIPPFVMEAAAFVVWAGTRGFPPGSVHLAVADPGVGSSRRALAILAGGSFYVGPDNGIFDLVLGGRHPDIAVALPRPEGTSPTFEGRDVFAPAAAALARGAVPADLGEPARDLVRLPARGPSVIWIDGFGNLVTGVRAAPRGLAINGREVRAVARTFSEVSPGELVCYLGSMGYVEIAAREARADAILGARLLDPVTVL